MAENNQMTDQIIIAPSVSNVLMQMQPDRAWLERRLHMALEYIDKIEADRREEHAAHVATKAAYTKFVEIVRSHMADPHSKSHSLVMFYLAKAPK